MSAQRAHEAMIACLRVLDRAPLAHRLSRTTRKAATPIQRIEAGGVSLSQALVLAAGLVKGDGFRSEDDALRALKSARNIVPGWRVVPALLGPVEFGSFTRFPRMGNDGTVMWRRENSHSTQNRVGLKNPGARAAAKFLGMRKAQLPDEFGINIAVSPGVHDINQQEREVIESLEFFLNEGVLPAWFTLNLSCPNTEDDPLGHQLEAETRRLCGAFIKRLEQGSLSIPLWVKISPGLAAEQYAALVRIFADVGVKAVVATNTLPAPSPADPGQIAGLGGGGLFDATLEAVKHLRAGIIRSNAAIDIVACGGILDGASFQAYRNLGVKAAQYWSALVYRGPLAAALIESELAAYEYEYEAVHSESLA
ncbi:MAG: hypothetical protein OXG39_00070 [Chloroflexi bacterium]|nr:hypothetical protein [Chloroflexota bacterium]